jgi:hypothetical protein
MERGPADLRAALAGVDARPEGRGHELRAQADAENGFLSFDATGDEGDFFFQEGVLYVVVDADGAAENDEEVAGVGLREGEGGLGGVEAFDL